MRILQINDNYKTLSGAEVYFWNLVKLLRLKKNDVYVFAFDDECSTSENEMKLSFPRGRLGGVVSRIFSARVKLALEKAILDFRPEIIHIHNNYLATVPVLEACRSSGIPLVQTVHDFMQICPRGWCVYQDDLSVCKGGLGWRCVTRGCISLQKYLVEALLSPGTTALSKSVVRMFISPSKTLASYLRRQGYRKISVLPYFIDLDLFPDSKPPRRTSIAYFGAISRYKGVFELLQAFKQVFSQRPDVGLKIVGSGPDLDRLKGYVKENKLDDRVEFFGKIPHSKVASVLKQTSFTVVPSLWMDNSPNVVYESLASGRPVVGSTRGGIHELIVNEKTGYICDPLDVPGLAGRMVELIDKPFLLRAMGENGSKFARSNFSRDDHYLKLMKLYASLL